MSCCGTDASRSSYASVSSFEAASGALSRVANRAHNCPASPRWGGGNERGSTVFQLQGPYQAAKYWLGILIYVIIALLMATLGFAAGESTAFQALNFIVSVAMFIGGIALGAKRLHDRDKSAWWLLLFYVVPSALFGIGALMFFYGIGAEAAGGVIGGVVAYTLGLVFLLWAIIEIGCLRGTVGPNRFGPDPLTAGPVP
jgi:uncharacterized membrane protein YhaH (DUF805 family)